MVGNYMWYCQYNSLEKNWLEIRNVCFTRKGYCNLQEEDEEEHKLLRLTNQAWAKSVVKNHGWERIWGLN